MCPLVAYTKLRRTGDQTGVFVGTPCLCGLRRKHPVNIQSDILSDCVSSDNNFLQSYLLSWSAQFGDIPEILPPKDHFGIALACWRTRWSHC